MNSVLSYFSCSSNVEPPKRQDRRQVSKWEILLNPLLANVFTYLDPYDLENVTLVNKHWKRTKKDNKDVLDNSIKNAYNNMTLSISYTFGNAINLQINGNNIALVYQHDYFTRVDFYKGLTKPNKYWATIFCKTFTNHRELTEKSAVNDWEHYYKLLNWQIRAIINAPSNRFTTSTNRHIIYREDGCRINCSCKNYYVYTDVFLDSQDEIIGFNERTAQKAVKLAKICFNTSKHKMVVNTELFLKNQERWQFVRSQMDFRLSIWKEELLHRLQKLSHQTARENRTEISQRIKEKNPKLSFWCDKAGKIYSAKPHNISILTQVRISNDYPYVKFLKPIHPCFRDKKVQILIRDVFSIMTCNERIKIIE